MSVSDLSFAGVEAADGEDDRGAVGADLPGSPTSRRAKRSSTFKSRRSSAWVETHNPNDTANRAIAGFGDMGRFILLCNSPVKAVGYLGRCRSFQTSCTSCRSCAAVSSGATWGRIASASRSCSGSRCTATSRCSRAAPLQDLFRKSHFLVFRFEGLDLAVNPMLAGRFRLCEPGRPRRGRPRLRPRFVRRRAAPSGKPPDRELRYLDDKKMGKAYLIATEDWKAIPGCRRAASTSSRPEFTRERFVSLLKHRRDQVRVFLLDKKALDSLGQRLRRRGAVRGRASIPRPSAGRSPTRTASGCTTRS